MKIGEIVARLFGLPLPAIRAFLVRAIEVAPDLEPTAQRILTALDAPFDFAALGRAIVTEIGNIGSGRIDPRDNPSNAI